MSVRFLTGWTCCLTQLSSFSQEIAERRGRSSCGHCRSRWQECHPCPQWRRRADDTTADGGVCRRSRWSCAHGSILLVLALLRRVDQDDHEHDKDHRQEAHQHFSRGSRAGGIPKRIALSILIKITISLLLYRINARRAAFSRKNQMRVSEFMRIGVVELLEGAVVECLADASIR